MQVSTRLIKVVTTAMLIGCLVLVLSWSSFVGPQPQAGGPKALARAYAARILDGMGILVLLLVVAGIGAVWIMRRTAAEFRSAEMENMRDLIEATRDDHRKKANEPVE